MAASEASQGHPIDVHAKWATSLWMGGAPGAWGLSDQAVMALGLVGEAIEVLAETMGDGTVDSAMKELGDVAYYWCICCVWIDAVPSGLWPAIGPAKPHQMGRAGQRDAAQLLCVAAGKGSEAAKKMIRDGNGSADLRAALMEMARRWGRCCEAFGFDWIDVLRANREKLEGRRERGTLGGSGNDR